MCDTQYKILSDKKIKGGAQGAVYLTIRGNKEYLTKNPVNKKEAEISFIMSDKIGPKIYDIYQCKNLEDTKKITKNNKKLKIKGRFMVMEKLEGLDLNDYLEEDIFIEDDEKWINTLINKIKKMHKLGYQHNDLTTSNIFIIFDKVNEVKDVKIIDFGRTRKLTKKGDINDYKTLLTSLETFGSHIADKIEPLIYTIEEELQKLQKGGNKKIKKQELTKEDVEKYLKDVRLLRYQNKYIKKIEKMTEIVLNEGFDICKETISDAYIENMFERYDNLDGFLVRYKKKTIGFIFFEINKKYIELILVCANKPKNLKIPLGQILIYKMEEYAKSKKIYKIRAHAVPDALSFYKKNGWKIIKEEKNEETFLIEKNIKTTSIIKSIYKFFGK